MISDRKLKITGKHIIISTIILVLIIGVAAYLNNQKVDTNVDGYSLTVCKQGKKLKTFTIKELRDMPSVTVFAKLQSAKKGNEEGNYTGTELSRLLDHVDKSILKDCKEVILTAGDAYSSAISIDDIKKKKNVIISYEKDGEPLTHFNEGGAGPLRAVVVEDTYGNRSAKFLAKLDCK